MVSLSPSFLSFLFVYSLSLASLMIYRHTSTEKDSDDSILPQTTRNLYSCFAVPRHAGTARDTLTHPDATVRKSRYLYPNPARASRRAPLPPLYPLKCTLSPSKKGISICICISLRLGPLNPPVGLDDWLASIQVSVLTHSNSYGADAVLPACRLGRMPAALTSSRQRGR